MDATKRVSIGVMLPLLSMLNWIAVVQGQFTYQNRGTDWTGACKNTDMQSPINILEYQSTCDVSHTFRFQVRNDTNTFNVQYDPTGVKIDSYFVDFFVRDMEKKFIGFNSSYMKIKIPAEHQINGESYDMELQITGDRKPGYDSKISQTIFSVLFRKVPSTQRVFADDPTFRTSSMMGTLDLNKTGIQSSNFSAVFAQDVTDPAYYFYQGSLTEPPCEERLWVIMINFLYLPEDEFERIKAILFSTPALKGLTTNAREIQIKGDRDVIRGGVDCSTYFGYVVAFVFLFIFMIYFVFKLL